MALIKLVYNPDTDTFIAADAAGNHISMKGGDDHARPGASPSVSVSVRPMQNLLMAMGGCSGIDVVSILNKMRQSFDQFEMEIDGEREEGAVPALWVKVHVKFLFSHEVDLAKAQHAASLSIDKYCSVAQTLKKAGCRITFEVKHL